MFGLIIFSGPSGSGKSTIAKEIIAKHKNFTLSVSSTTRKKREQEVEGKDKLFISKEEFQSKISQNAFFEYVEVFGNYYGTSKDFIFQTLKTSNVILDIEYLGAEKIKEKISEYNQTEQEKIQLLTIFILPDNVESLIERLKKRGESEESIKIRMQRVQEEMQNSHKYDFCIKNIVLENTIKEVEEILRKKDTLSC